MNRFLHILLLACAAAAGGCRFQSSPKVSAPVQDFPSQTPEGQKNTVWVGQALSRMLTLKPGMTREQLLTVFTTEGGLSTRLQRTYVSQDCYYFKVNVTFRGGIPGEDTSGRVTYGEDDRDIIATISQPYLQFGTVD